MAGINIPISIPGLKQAKENLTKLNEEFEAAKKRGDDQATKKLAKEYNDLSKAIDKTTDELLEMNKAGKLVGTRFDDLNEVLFDTQQEILPLSSQIGEMEDRMYQLASAGDTSSEEFKSLQKETVRLRKVIIDTDKSIDLLAENQGLSVFAEGWSQVGSSILSLNFEQAALDADRLNSSVGNLGQIGKSSIKGLIQTVGTLSKTFIKFGVSLLLNPLFLLIAVVTGIIAAIVVFRENIKFLGDAFDFLMKPVKLIIESFKKLTDWLGLTTHAENEAIDASKKRAEAIKKEIAALDKQIQAEKNMHSQRMGQLNAELELAKERGEGIEEAQARVDKASIEGLQQDKANFIARKKLQLKEQEELEKQLLKQAIMEDKGVERMKGSNREYRKQIEYNAEFRKQIEENNFAVIEEINAKIAIVEQQALNRTREHLEETQKENYEKYKEYQQRRLDAARQIQDLELELMAEGTDKDLAALKLKYDRLIEDTKTNEALLQTEKDKLVKHYESLRAAEKDKRLQEDLKREAKKQEELRKIQEEAILTWLAEEEELSEVIRQAQQDATQNEIDAVNEKYFNLIEMARQHNLDTQALEEEHQKKLTEIEQRENAKRIMDAQAVQDAKLNMAVEGLSLISSATELFGKKNEKNAKRAFEVNKAAQIAQAVISTYQGANAIFASAAANPATVLFPAQPFIAAGLAVASGLVNVAKIAQTKFEGGTPSGGGGGSAPSIGGGGASSSASSSPNFNLFGQSNNLDEAQSATSQETTQMIQVQAVVSETEITSTQQAVQQMQQNAEL